MGTADKNLKFNRQCFLDFLRLCKPYWASNEKKFAYLCLIAIIFFTLVAVESNVFLTIFNKNFFNSLVSFNKPLLIKNILYITGTIFIILLAYGYAFYFTSFLEARWQKWLTKHYINQWLANKTYYWMNYLKNNIDNPDQRITEDIAQFSTMTLALFFTIFQSFLSFFSFGYILWNISGSLSFSIAGLAITLPGYLFFSAIIVSVMGTWIIHLIGKKLSILNYEQQACTVNFRFSLINFRQANEEIAFHKGEQAELKKFDGLFSKIYYNFMNIVPLKKG